MKDRRKTRRVVVVAAVVVLCLCVGGAFNTPLLARAMAAVRAMVVLQDAPTSGNPGPELISIASTPYGFDPEEISLSPGAYILVVRNRTGADEMTYTIEAPGRDVVLSGTLEAGRNLSRPIAFSPGEYSVTESSHPEWTCRITVTP